jgi:purine nucleoside permease
MAGDAHMATFMVDSPALSRVRLREEPTAGDAIRFLSRFSERNGSKNSFVRSLTFCFLTQESQPASSD